ncbi:MAG: MFS transporter [Armatimonadetes bacterium]|nr:MFS transporter [Anaerolineae bacterium]
MLYAPDEKPVTLSRPPANMRLFLFIWSGQTASRFGSYITAYALDEFWVWEQTGVASTSATIGVMSLLGAVLAALFGGTLVDRLPRKTVMIVSDIMAALGTVVYLLLFLNGTLQVWHLYIGAAVVYFFAELHGLAFLAATTMLVPRNQYARAGSLRFLTHYGALILAGPLAALLYRSSGLGVIMLIDLATVTLAVGTTLLVKIPDPIQSGAGIASRATRWKEISYGFRLIRRTPSLLTFVVVMALFTYAHDGGEAVYNALVLSRTGNDFGVIGAVGMAAGLGGLLGALLMTAWGGPRRKIIGWLLATLSAGLAKLTFSQGRSVVPWFAAQFWSSVNFPIRGGLKEGLLLAKITPDVQGRYFGAELVIMYCVGVLARLTIAPFADAVLEPAMQTGGALVSIFGGVFGVGAGAGYAVTYAFTSLGIIVSALVGLLLPGLRQLDTRVPDYAYVLEDE